MQVVFCTNERFAPAASLLKLHFPHFKPKTFGSEGQVYDGWEVESCLGSNEKSLTLFLTLDCASQFPKLRLCGRKAGPALLHLWREL